MSELDLALRLLAERAYYASPQFCPPGILETFCDNTSTDINKCINCYRLYVKSLFLERGPDANFGKPS